MGKNQAKAKQHPEAEFLLFEFLSLSLSTLSSKNNSRYSKKCSKNNYFCLNEVTWLITMKARLKMKNKSYKYNINRLKPRDGHKYTKYKVSLSIMMVICIKQHVSNT